MRENSATADLQPTTEATRSRPDVPLPAGATTDDDGWEFWNNECRVFRGAERTVLNGAAEVGAEVRTCGLQLPDGSVDNGEDAPTIDLYLHIGELDGDQARDLARVLLEAASELDRWRR